ncbi:MAG: hypothetical protein HOD03_05910 [Planctomycetes bacterium]|nr:hypothetical protein [Planctomycetota bacterium]
MNRIFNSIILVAAMCATSSAFSQSTVLDQSETHDNVVWGMQYYSDMQQDVKVGVDGTLAGFEIQILTTDVTVGLPVAIWDSAGPHVTSPLWSGIVYASQAGAREWVYADCSAAAIQLIGGDVITIRVGDGLTFTSVPFDLVGNSGWPNAYYAEPFYIDLNYRNTDRLTFKTYMDVPTPALTATGTCGGSMTFNVANGTGNFWLIYGNAGQSTVFGIDLQIANPALATTMGSSLTVNVPAGACGKTLQAVDMVYLIPSNPIVL